ncbi:type IV pilus twitching motility protein PilT [Chloracidobacterium aggregatum]|uniref:Type IV pilus twitching motility protein PilT n=1 Tax=Chloracidobacterium sp. N TaxID=2821540 RepID=A0ABX8B0E4_9BACT|nr:type IV pilus twitching motility protein PilT [Chloracidobacterium aggregatum]QUV83685.1 type IV pilus twitching motility protein PilT [Chloracidobacterium sp. 2]QUV87835.1 type IV pilus twitching motility protein PilT [Chloracidobacterium sp. S]QUV90733.1 type IV pilus twitching motility protein PilT [Chloracidobacterium sp. A]QUV93948.1 type IV pilus twitching motility protein PilT [Chloracidobacterium sp. N]QUV97140.1 type IV pilus twitching motility protein PilT [Chloracidobacterium sp.
MQPPLTIDTLLALACSKGASDLHIKAGSHPFIRVNGELMPLVDVPRLSPEDTLAMAFSIMNNRQKQRFKDACEVDIAYGVSGLGRFRCNVFQQRGAVGMVFRVIPMTVRTVSDLQLPAVIEKIADERRGLVLVTGTTGSGKSTTLAAIIDCINRNRTEHIITIEDPIEFLHRDRRSFVNQREVDVDTRNFHEALRGALRQDPDVILVGEMRDQETIETALTAAETGHLVLSTLHTLDATETITRIVSIFPPHQQQAIRLQLASVLKAVISQRLVRNKEGTGRVPAVEVLISTAYIRDCIINQEKTPHIRDAIAQGTSQYGMQTFDQSLHDLLNRGLISYEQALAGASNRDEFVLRTKGIQTTSDQAREEMEKRITTRAGDLSLSPNPPTTPPISRF